MHSSLCPPGLCTAVAVCSKLKRRSAPATDFYVPGIVRSSIQEFRLLREDTTPYSMENLYEFMVFWFKTFRMFRLSVCRPQNTRVQLVAPLPVCLFRWAKVYIPALRVFEVFEGQRALMNNNEQPVSIGVFVLQSRHFWQRSLQAMRFSTFPSAAFKF